MAKKERVGVKSYLNHLSNPSIDRISGFVKKRYTVKAGEKEVFDENGEVFIMRSMDKTLEQWKDERSYIKLYRDSLFKLGNLSTPALKLFVYVSYNLVKNSDEIVLDAFSFLRAFNYSTEDPKKANRSNFYNALSELLELEILYRKAHTESTYFIDVDVFFNGKRDGVFNKKKDSDFDKLKTKKS